MPSPQENDALTRAARLFQIVTLLRSRRPGQRLGRAALAEACGCDTRTIQRDIDLLQMHAHVPLAYDRKGRTYALTDAGWTYPVVHLTVEDALALALARGLLAAPGFPHQGAILAALDKAASGLAPALRDEMAQAAGVLRADPLRRDYSQAPVAALLDAARSRRSVEIDYQSRSRGERAWRRVDPYQVELRDGQFWEMHAWCHTRQRILTFALDQVQGVTTDGQPFTVRDPEWAAFTRVTSVIGGVRGGVEVQVDVRFAPAVASYARDRQWPDTLRLRAEPGGTVRLTGVVQGVDGLLVELLRWRRHVLVLGGPELRARMAEEVRAMAALYPDEEDQDENNPKKTLGEDSQ